MRKITSKRHRLAARWDKKLKDLLVDCSPRFGNGDLRFLLDILSKEVLVELEKRGFDLSTLVFHIDKTPEAILEHEISSGRAKDQKKEPQPDIVSH